jgi:FlgD Ig-like domain
VDAQTGYASGYSGTILRTTDFGGTWTGQSSHAMHNLYSVCFPLNVQTGYVVGNSGTILKTTDGGASFVEQEAEVRGRKLEVKWQAAPNPFSEGTVIRYELSSHEAVRLAVYDIAGHLVKVLVSETKPAGVYEVAWNGRGAAGSPLPSGVYLIRLEAGPFREIRKAVLLR